MFDGELAYRLTCRGHAAKVRLLDELASYDAEQPDVRRAAEYIAAGARTAEEQIGSLHRYVQQHVTFTREPTETFSPTLHTLEVGAGDCDDSARALVALLRSLGHHARLQTLGDPPTHVAAAVYSDGAWRWAETTIPAQLGEHPIAAAKRLGVKMRPDLQQALAQHAIGAVFGDRDNPRSLGELMPQSVSDVVVPALAGSVIGVVAVLGARRNFALGIAGAAMASIALSIALGGSSAD